MSLNVQYLIEHFAYFGIVIALVGGIIGLPIPDEILLTYVGYTIYQGHLLLLPALLVAVFAAMCGISLSYFLGRKLGLPFIKKFGPTFHITEKRLHLSGRLFSKLGSYFIFLGFFIPGVRHVTAYLAAIHGYSFRKFSLFAFSGAAVWATTFIILGNVFGDQWSIVESYFIKYSAFFIPACITALVIAVLVFYRKKTVLKQNM
ncbi:DedA family protein [Bacillus sp. 1P06AnD]|uniref:DedA family protein n=1 Tax=Bacillus sp. 1P06AnD TaxID=3132208 RepID=UPI0039A17F45